MTIEHLIESATKYNDLNAATYFKMILEFSKVNNLSINDSIEYLLTVEKKKYNRNLLMVAQKYFPKLNNK